MAAAKKAPAIDLGTFEIHEVDSKRWKDFERLFEARGGPKYCWCMVHRAARPDDEVADRPGRKAAMKKRIKKNDDEIAALETRIASAESDRERNDLLLCSEEVFRDGERVKKIQQQNQDLKAMIDLLYGKWETLSKERDELGPEK